MIWTVVVIFLILILLGSFPTYPYSRAWGWGPSGLLGTILVVVLVIWLLNHLL